MEMSKMEQVYQQVLRRSMTDEDYRKALLANPAKAIEEETGFAVPADYKVRIGEDVSAEDLDAVAGGLCGANFAPCGAEACGGKKG